MTESPGNLSLMALMIPFEGAITTIKPESWLIAIIFFSMSYKNIMNQIEKKIFFGMPDTLRINK